MTTLKQYYSSDWQFFNTLITGVTLSEEQLFNMFGNLPDREIKAWIEEVKCCYTGTEDEEEAYNMKEAIDLAKFYANHPITD